MENKIKKYLETLLNSLGITNFENVLSSELDDLDLMFLIIETENEFNIDIEIEEKILKFEKDVNLNEFIDVMNYNKKNFNKRN